MQRRFLFVAVLVLIASAFPRSGDGATLQLAWNECASSGGTALLANSCASSLTTLTLVPSFAVDATVDSVVALELVIDVVAEGSVLPDFWRFDPGGCNAGALSASADFSALGGCTDPWQGHGVALAQGWTVSQPRGAANQARLLVVASVPAAQFAALQPGTDYYAARVRISLQHVSGVPTCPGCSGGACLVFNSIQAIRKPGAQPETVFLQTPQGGTAAIASWQNQEAPCASVPVRNKTWGALKGLYR